MALRPKLIEAQVAHLIGHIKKHVANVEVLLECPVGIGEHQDIQEAIDVELGHISNYHDKLEMLKKFFIPQENKPIENKEEEEGVA